MVIEELQSRVPLNEHLLFSNGTVILIHRLPVYCQSSIRKPFFPSLIPPQIEYPENISPGDPPRIKIYHANSWDIHFLRQPGNKVPFCSYSLEVALIWQAATEFRQSRQNTYPTLVIHSVENVESGITVPRLIDLTC